MNIDRFDRLLEQHVVEVLHDESDTFVNLELAAAVRHGGGTVLIGEHSLTPSEARMLAASLVILANVAEPLSEVVRP